MVLVATLLVLDLALGMLIRAVTRRAIWSVLACVLIPPLTAVIPFGLDNLLDAPNGDRGMAHYYAVLGFTFLAFFGLAASATGALLGRLLRFRNESANNILG
jgi:hypothetical protein